MLNSLVERVNSTQLTEKDPDAATLLQRGFSTNPDAVYVLSQTVLVQNIALEQAHGQLSQAQEQIQQLQGQLQQQSQQPAHSTSFLGSLLGHRDPAPPPVPAYQPVYQPQGQPEYQTPYNPAPPYQGQPYGGPQYAGAPPIGQGFGQPSFLRSAAQTAAGVAAGALAFEGVEALLHGGFGHPGMGMGMGGWGMPGVGFGMGPGMGFERPVEETVVNNYYDSPGGGSEHSFEHGGEHFRESSGDGNAQLQDASWNNDSGSGFDDNSGGNFDSDDGGSFDSGGDSGGDGGVF
jgi:hypothetical protein